MILENFENARHGASEHLIREETLAGLVGAHAKAPSWEDVFEQRFDKLMHMGQFLYRRDLNSRAMDDWNYRLVQFAHLSEGSPGRFERHGFDRILNKFEKACLKQLREHGRLEEWRANWEALTGTSSQERDVRARHSDDHREEDLQTPAVAQQARASDARVEPVGRFQAADEQLKKLAELRDAGVLSEAEFSSKRAELLARL